VLYIGYITIAALHRLHNIGKIEILEIMFLDVITCGDDENNV